MSWGAKSIRYPIPSISNANLPVKYWYQRLVPSVPKYSRLTNEYPFYDEKALALSPLWVEMPKAFGTPIPSISNANLPIKYWYQRRVPSVPEYSRLTNEYPFYDEKALALSPLWVEVPKAKPWFFLQLVKLTDSWHRISFWVKGRER